ncbi:MAG TPA: methyltransferase domain-containing protein [Thermoplasmataceae archaeon]|nr:methyltransferase domain-containing protein [Thermoplasmataceae archaeon]
MDVKEFFGKYAEEYAKSDSHAKGSDLELLISLLNVNASLNALDLATGTGFTAVALAKKVKHVAALDKTSEMLLQARKLAESENTANIEFVVGDVEKLPYSDGEFDIVTSRRAPHHFSDKPAFLAEAFRVLKPGGTLGISDMVSPEGDVERRYDKFEAIRDPSHAGAETLTSWKRLLKTAGFQIREAIGYEDRIRFEKWLHPVPMESEEGKECLEFLTYATPEFKKLIGFMEDDTSFIKKRAVIVAGKPA